EEIESRKEYDGLTAEKKQIEALLASNAKQWSTIKWEVTQVHDKFGPETELGKRRTQFADAPEHDLTDIAHAMIEREPVTVVVSEKGWLRAMKGHLTDYS
ncbi:DNA topoisomerase IV subunit A, partial [Mesorhizobium sp. M2D.F.Ca.ET.223.01.1.1]